jgi:phage shock protein A
MGSSIEKKVLEEKKQSLITDIEKLEQTITQLADQQKQIQANMYALHGALQQCDQFLEMLDDEPKEEEE